MATLGRAFIEIVADTSKFPASVRRQVERALKSGLEQPAASSGKRAGKALADGLDKGIGNEAKKTGKRVTDDVAKGMKSNERKVTETASQIAKRLGIKFEDGMEVAGLRAVDKAAREIRRLGLEIDSVGTDSSGRFFRAFDRESNRHHIFRLLEKDATLAGKGIGGALIKGFGDSFAVIAAESNGVIGTIARVGSKAVSSLAESGAGGPAAIIGLTTALGLLATTAVGVASVVTTAMGVIFAVPAGLTALVGALAVAKLAFQNFGDAVSLALKPDKTEAQIKKLNKTVANMAPAARGVFREFQKLIPQFKTIQKAAEQGFFSAFAGALTKAKPLLGVVAKGVGQVASALGGLASQFVAFLSAPAQRATIAQIFANIAAAIKVAAPLLLRLTGAFLGFLARSGPALDKLLGFLGGLIEGFATWLDGLSADDISSIVDKGIESLGLLLTVVEQVGKVLFTVLLDPRIQEAGANLVGSIGELATSFAQFFDTQDGQDALDNLAVLIGAIAGTLRGAGKALEIWGKAWSGLKDVIAAIGGFFADIGPKVGAFFAAIPGAIGDFFAGLPAVIGGALGAVGDFFADLGRSIATGFGNAVSAVGNFFASLPGLILGALQAGLLAVAEGLGFIVGSIIAFFIQLPGQIAGALSSLGSLLVSVFTTAFTFVATTVTTAVANLIAFFVALPGQIVAAVQALPGLLATFFTNVWLTVQNLAVTGLAALVAFVRGLPGRIMSAINSLFSLLRGFWTRLWSDGRKQAETGIDGIIDFFRKLPGQIAGALSAIGSGVWSGLKALLNEGIDLINAFISGLNKGLGKVGLSLGTIPHVANGGMFFGPTRALIGEAGPEVVIPLTRPARAAALAERSGLTDILARQGIGGGPQITINAPITVVAPNADPNLVAVKVAARLARLAVV